MKTGGGNLSVDEELRRSFAVAKAEKNALRRAGYEETDKRTRYLDTIFRNTNNGQYFTVQGDRMVRYRGAKVGSSANSNSVG